MENRWWGEEKRLLGRKGIVERRKLTRGEENCRAGEGKRWENEGMFEEDWLISTPNLICLCAISMLTSKEIFTST
jgi:hypothetical protein